MSGALVRDVLDLNRLLREDPAEDALIMAGVLLGDDDHVEAEWGGVTLEVVRERYETVTRYAVLVTERGVVTSKLEVLYESSRFEVRFVLFEPGAWLGHLTTWFHQVRTGRQLRLLPAGG